MMVGKTEAVIFRHRALESGQMDEMFERKGAVVRGRKCLWTEVECRRRENKSNM